MGLFSKKNMAMGLASSLSRVAFGPVASGIMGAGVIANMAYEAYNKKIQEARKEGFKDGERAGNINTKKKYADELEKTQNTKKIQIGIYALAVYVARLDREIEEAEAEVLDKVAGEIDAAWQHENLQAKLKEIYQNCPSFVEICQNYFSDISLKALKDIDEKIVQPMIWADGVVDSREDEFYEEEWKPFLFHKYNSITVETDKDTESFYSGMFPQIHGSFFSVYSRDRGQIQTVYVMANQDVTQNQPLYSVLVGGGITVVKSPVSGNIAILKVSENMKVYPGLEAVVIREA